MSNLDKPESSRRNGAKSHGPVSPEGRERSSRNAVKFGLYTKRVRVLSTEQQEDLDALRDQYFQEWRPTDRRQSDLVEKLIDSEWRFIRYSAYEKWLVEDMLAQMLREVDETYATEPDLDLRAALAYDRLYKQGPTLEKFQRERQRLTRIIDRITAVLQGLQKDTPPVVTPTGTTNQNIENEPENPVETECVEPAEPDETPESRAVRWCPALERRRMHYSEPPEVAFAVAS